MNYNLSFTFDDKFLGAVNVLSLVDLFNQSTNQFLSGTIYSAHLVDCDFVHDRNKANCLRKKLSRKLYPFITSIYYNVRFQYGHCCLIQQITDISFLFLYRKAINMYMSCLVDLSKTAQ
ncbi:hypothetical protein T07_13102 [Trichinella nelsoni]|uniref:Uncharacterized protein n=1 Tax=Trichinella nelsoni TaxID=6336 RepID=A0A0V0RU32_9BILA|nr:hypothetical protein T07_13102 [Trichinella nelsoni]